MPAITGMARSCREQSAPRAHSAPIVIRRESISGDPLRGIRPAVQLFVGAELLREIPAQPGQEPPA